MKAPDLSRDDQFAIGAFAIFLGFCLFFADMKMADAGEPVRFTVHQGIAVAEFNEPCPTGTEACYDVLRQAVYYTSEESRTHELEHVAGMRHTEWVAAQAVDWPWKCARVTDGGKTHWRVGEAICRTPRGEYVSGGT